MDNEILDYVSYVDGFMINTLVQIVANCTLDESVYSEYNEAVSEVNPAVSFQYYYNDQYNKCYIEFKFNEIFRNNYQDQLARIIERLQNAVKYDLTNEKTVWPELVLISYKRRKICDSSPILTPFTIGYWKSLTGQYGFITDQIKVLCDYVAIAAPVQSDDYITKVKEIYDNYYTTDFEKFTEEMYNASITYGAKYDQKPTKNFADFINSVEELSKEYQQTSLDDEEMQNFITDYMTLLTEHASDPNFQTLLAELYNTYSIKTNLQEKIPEMFEQYRTLYEDFMGKKLPVLEVDSNHEHDDDRVEIWWYDGDFDFGEYLDGHNLDTVEIWSYDGDFDFGDLEEGTDPDSVAKEDYDYNESTVPEDPEILYVDPDSVAKEDYEYNKAAYINTIFNTNYDICTGKVTE